MEKETDNLHKEVVTGIVQVIKYISNEKSDSIGLDKLLEVGYNGRSKESKSYILEFIKDGIVNLPQSIIEEVSQENYKSVWNATNNYLKMFGHDPVDSEPISLDSY